MGRFLRLISRLRARPKVFGLGLSKTGTSSLQVAFKRLGYHHHGYDPDLLEAWRAGDADRFFTVTDRYESFEDWPYPLAYGELMDRYGTDARYVLTLRASPAVWLESYIAHADRSGPANARYRRLATGFEHPRGHEAEHLALYDSHARAVREAAARRGLDACFAELCWERGDGWPELVRLLGRRAPPTPFPHANQRPDRASA
jgi:hypothetical protein